MEDALVYERRATRRVSTVGSNGMDRARLRPGRTAYVVDLSAGGALIETDWRLLPGTRVELQVGDPTTVFKVTGRILRCHVSLLSRERIRYRGALAFEERVPFGELATPRVELEPRGIGEDFKTSDEK